jgi:hypothetical protein
VGLSVFAASQEPFLDTFFVRVPLFLIVFERGTSLSRYKTAVPTHFIVLSFYVFLGTLLLYSFFILEDEEWAIPREVSVYILERPASRFGIEKIHFESYISSNIHQENIRKTLPIGINAKLNTTQMM